LSLLGGKRASVLMQPISKSMRAGVTAASSGRKDPREQVPRMILAFRGRQCDSCTEPGRMISMVHKAPLPSSASPRASKIHSGRMECALIHYIIKIIRRVALRKIASQSNQQLFPGRFYNSGPLRIYMLLSPICVLSRWPSTTGPPSTNGSCPHGIIRCGSCFQWGWKIPGPAWPWRSP
jgi:hypothetical protein